MHLLQRKDGLVAILEPTNPQLVSSIAQEMHSRASVTTVPQVPFSKTGIINAFLLPSFICLARLYQKTLY